MDIVRLINEGRPGLTFFDDDIEVNKEFIGTGTIWVSLSKNAVFIRDKGKWVDTTSFKAE